MAAIDPLEFRRALGTFTTGVTIVTTRSESGEAIGVTANSFNSVSLTPPIVLWSLAKSAKSLSAFTETKHWNVHILSMEQQALSATFARPGADKFAGVSLDQGVTTAPLLPECAARFQCRTTSVVEAGDHIVLLGEVLAFDASDRPPLAYSKGRYSLTSHLEHIALGEQEDLSQAEYDDELLGYLLGRAHHQMLGQIRSLYESRGLDDLGFFALATLLIRRQIDLETLQSLINYTGLIVTPEAMTKLVAMGYVQRLDNEFALTQEGHQVARDLIRNAQGAERALIERLGLSSTQALITLLKQVIVHTDPGLPSLWTPSKEVSPV
ncbi:MAG: hypothetical protein RLY30_1422 [Pseudomonadota bacterium]|jgi:3-hydroxy-9,10-secoandrosta-1,3,5(10)-triene-9,17-dione monooxygenase reductase component